MITPRRKSRQALLGQRAKSRGLRRAEPRDGCRDRPQAHVNSGGCCNATARPAGIDDVPPGLLSDCEVPGGPPAATSSPFARRSPAHRLGKHSAKQDTGVPPAGVATGRQHAIRKRRSRARRRPCAFGRWVPRSAVPRGGSLASQRVGHPEGLVANLQRFRWLHHQRTARASMEEASPSTRRPALRRTSSQRLSNRCAVPAPETSTSPRSCRGGPDPFQVHGRRSCGCLP